MNYLFNWSWLLVVALFIPVDLPAGGGSFNNFKTISNTDSKSYFAGESCILFSNPSLDAPVLCSIHLSTPLRVIRSWKTSSGKNWLLIQVTNLDFLDQPNHARKGWISV